jgi:cyclophilin family peptidyl-prolyl cis-trans isomerase
VRFLLLLSVVLSVFIHFAHAETTTAPVMEYVELQTNIGTITVKLDYDKAPISSNNFIAYVKSGFYKKTLIHRVVKGFVVQGGGMDMSSFTFKTTNPPIINESTNGLSNVTGTIAMARTADPNSATSQFYINVADNTNLDYVNAGNPGYAVFGNVVAGMDVVKKIENFVTYQQMPYSENSNLIFIENVFASATRDPLNPRIRAIVSGPGKVTSLSAGIDCGVKCSITLPVELNSTVKLSAQPNPGALFAGWRGDCQGLLRNITLDLHKGNHNCTAVFIKPSYAAQ